MKTSASTEELAARLKSAASKSLIKNDESKKKVEKTPILIRLNEKLYKHFLYIATARTKQSGRGVSIQQVIIEALESHL